MNNDKREQRNMLQRIRRANETGSRMAMLAWSNGPKGKAARKKWIENGGNEVIKRLRKKRSIRDKEENYASISNAENHRQIWTLKEEESLIAMRKRGNTIREISVILSRSIKGVTRKLERLNPLASSSETE